MKFPKPFVIPNIHEDCLAIKSSKDAGTEKFLHAFCAPSNVMELKDAAPPCFLLWR